MEPVEVGRLDGTVGNPTLWTFDGNRWARLIVFVITKRNEHIQRIRTTAQENADDGSGLVPASG